MNKPLSIIAAILIAFLLAAGQPLLSGCQAAAALNDISYVGFSPVKYCYLPQAPNSLASADFNNDGFPDLAMAVKEQNVVMIMLGSANTNYAGGYSLSSAVVSPDRLLVEDFTNDGRLDIAVMSRDTQSIALIEGMGDMTFEREVLQSWVDNTNPWDFKSADFDGDGILDIATAQRYSNHIDVLFGDGKGYFGNRKSFLVESGPVSVGIADLNKDGFLDIYACNYSSDSISILYGKDKGEFGGQYSLKVGDGPIAATSADFNGDGLADLAVANEKSHDVSIVLQKKGQVFDVDSSLSVWGDPGDIIAADFNRDGNPDLATANTGNNQLTMLENRGQGQFFDGKTMNVDQQPQQVIAVDADKDGLLDLISANKVGRNLSLFLNTSVTPAMIQLEKAAYSVPGAQSSIKIKVVRTGNLNSYGEADYETSDMSAKAGVNYVAATGTVRFSAGESSKIITIKILNDPHQKDDLKFRLTLTKVRSMTLFGDIKSAEITVKAE